MQPEEMQVLSALVDGELVDLEDLARVLETPEGRAVLVDFVRLRRAVQDDEEAPMASADALRVRLRTRAPLWSVARYAAAAAVLALAVLGALDLGGLVRSPALPSTVPAAVPARAADDAPPHVAREIALVDWQLVKGDRP